MSEQVQLIRAILQEAAPSDAAAVGVLQAAADMGVDPIDYCTHRCKLTGTVVMARASEWAGLAFSPSAPTGVSGSLEIRQIDSLATVRTIRSGLGAHERVFCAPGFGELLNLAAYVRDHPELRDRLCLVPIGSLRAELAGASALYLMDEARQRLARRWPFASAHLDLPTPLRLAFVVAVLGTVAASALAPLWFKPLFMPLVGVLLVAPAVVRFLAALRPQDPAAPVIRLLTDAELPIYSVLIPLRDEARMVPLLSKAMTALDYPPEKLDIKFVVESRSPATIAAVRSAASVEQHFGLVVVPDAKPHTKPKALNYALPLVRGEFVVVYDGEDIPAPDQLRRAASAMASDPSLDCLQAELIIDNAQENWLTALFAGEYAGQFGLMLPFLASQQLPMPLGGTSNHFRTRSLREIGGWDAFNVTEDADLGVRLARLVCRTATIDSRTREEAPISLLAWMAQRTRWTKGWMQTFIVHNRSPRRFLADIGWRGFLAFQIYVGGMIISALLHSVFLASFVIALILGFGREPVFDAWDVVSVLILLVGYAGAGTLVIAGLLRLRQPHLLVYQLALPLYWVLYSIATVRALHELLVRPYFWAKTTHGRTCMPRESAAATADLRVEVVDRGGSS